MPAPRRARHDAPTLTTDSAGHPRVDVHNVSAQSNARAAAPPPLDAKSAAALRLWVILARAHAAIASHAAEDVSRHGLTLAEFGILEALYHRGPMLLGEVQRRILVSSGGITFLVDRLTAKGFVERRSCPSDRRARYAALTPSGEQLVAEIFPEHADALTRAMGGLTTTQQEAAAELIRTLGLHATETPLPADFVALPETA